MQKKIKHILYSHVPYMLCVRLMVFEITEQMCVHFLISTSNNHSDLLIIPKNLECFYHLCVIAPPLEWLIGSILYHTYPQLTNQQNSLTEIK